MQPLLESFESFFYVLVNTLPVGIGIGLLFFGIGFLFTNPRIKRLRQQIANYKEEVARMARRQAQVTTQHQELLESLQAVENENLALQSSLETKNEELIDLLDRLNNVAVEAEPHQVGASDSIATENTRLRKRIAELTGRLRTSESALQDRKVELSRARSELARVGVPQEAAAGGGSGSGGDDGWRPNSPLSGALPEEPETETPATGKEADSEDDKDLRNAADAFVEQQTGFEPSDTGAKPTISTEKVAARFVSGEDEATENGKKTDPGDSTADPGSDNTKTLEIETTALEGQLADFEERLRAREAEFFALQEQLSFTPLDTESTSSKKPSDPAPDASKASTSKSPASSSSNSRTSAKKQTAARESASAPETSKNSDSASPFPPLSNKEAPAPSAKKAASPEPSSELLAPGEQLIFRGIDPAMWRHSSGAGLIPPENVRKSTKFLRLRRTDSGQSVIVRINKKDLTTCSNPESTLGWNGSSDILQSAHHLGIFDHSLPQEVETHVGAGGWGFGHHSNSREGQAYSWAGVSIPVTEFEISVLSKLPDAATLKQSNTTFLHEPTFAPSTDEELVFFHSACPEIWNKNAVDGRGGFAFHLSRTPKNTRFLRVRRTDNGSAVIVPITRDKIVTKSGNEKRPGWNGSNEFLFAGHHLGIYDPASAKEIEIAHGSGGYGFGHLVDSSERQAVAWAGKAISRIPLEFTAIARELTTEEKAQLLGA